MRKVGTTRRAAAILLPLFAGSCAHTGIRKVGDCDQVPAEQRVACAACTVKNEAQGWIGDYEYKAGQRSVGSLRPREVSPAQYGS